MEAGQMKRVKQVRVGGASQLDLTVTVDYGGTRRALSHREEEAVFQDVLDAIHAACLQSPRYHTVRPTDVEVR
jgi:hypothetical protein